MIQYQCTQCGKTYSRDEVRYLCPVCSADYKPGQPLMGVLLTLFDYDYIAKKFTYDAPDWNLFSAVEEKYFPDYKCGNTPFFRVKRLGEKIGFSNLWIKNDSLNPSGSLKDRASFLVAAEANRTGETKIVCASTGNAASSIAAVCAAEGKESVIFVPSSAPRAKLVQIKLYGAKVSEVDGTYDDAFRLSIEYSDKNGGLNRNTAYHPLTIEGKKTAGLEIFAQNGFKVPDAIIIPVGDGVILSGVYKAFYDLMKAGLTNNMPKLICAQAVSSNAIHNFIKTGVYKDAEKPCTIADSISVKTPSNAYMTKKAVDDSGGFSIEVTDEEIMNAQKTLASSTGIFAEPSSSAVAAALLKIKEQSLIDANEQIVLLITGHGLKDIDSPFKFFKD